MTTFLLLSCTAASSAQEWTRFRGPNGSGISSANLPVRWTEKDFNWKVKLPGRGHSAPVLWGQRIFVTSGDDKTGLRILLCLDARDGKQLWRKDFPGPLSGKHEDNSFASATPAVDDRHVYVSWANAREYLVIALDHAGKEIWRVDLGPFRSGHGFGASPIVYEDLVIVANDQDGDSSVLALQRTTGDVRWKVPRKSKSSFATPCVFKPNGKPAEVIFCCYEHGLTAIDPATGKITWERDVFAKGHIESTIASPIVSGDFVLGTCGWLGVNYETVAVRPYSPNPKKSDTVYRMEKIAPLVPTPLVKDDLLFLWNDRGVVTCANLKTGEVFWKERVPGSYYGSPVCAGDKLYCMSREGEVVVLAAARKFRLLGRNLLGEGSHSTPAIVGRTMYLRTFSHLISIGQ
ncbi:MAG TPA: PQQ-binding-like beta-propeller repeat protein [Gemmataceae bacterium]|nr:PQQ-binding-like beta-propeller repeat protein [Gemmataceae bacterium]